MGEAAPGGMLALLSGNSPAANFLPLRRATFAAMKIHVLDLGFLQLEHAIAAFLLEGPDGIALIETGPHSTFPQLEKAVGDKGFHLKNIQHAFLSHIHFDHAGAAWALAEQGAKIYVHPKGLPHLASPERLYNSARQIYGDQMDTLWGAMRPIPETQLYAPGHGEVIGAAGLHFTAWYTPGHAVHHIAWEVTTTPPQAPPAGERKGVERINAASSFPAGVLFTGDVAGVKIDEGPVMPPCPPPDINIEDWINSLQILRERPSETLYLTHFGRVDHKQAHLDALEQRLLDWAAWMRPHAEAAEPPQELIPLFQHYVAGQLEAAGIGPAGQSRYEAANPAFMSVAGLMRYWKKKLENRN